MPKRAMESMTESMFYTLLALLAGPRCGTEIAAFAKKLTEGRVVLGPGTLYTILSRFLEVGYLRETSTEGRKRTYELTAEGRRAYEEELGRLRRREDAEAAPALLLTEGGVPDAREGSDPAAAPLPAL